MKTITREKHLSYLSKLAPLLIVAYVLQSYLYFKIDPSSHTTEVIIFLGLSLGLLYFLFVFHDTHHKVVFHENYVEVRFDLFRYHEEFLYRSVESVEVVESRFKFSKVVINLYDGEVIQLHNVDDGKAIADYLNSRR